MIWLLLGELALVLISILIALTAPRLGSGIFGSLEARLAGLARRKELNIFLVGIVALAAGGLPRLIEGMPRPQKHDEFAHLLGGDTFAIGRATNPAHPMWQHFESFHILQQPTYMSMEPPGLALLFAAGKIVFGRPWFGLWVGMAVFCAALYWALTAWLPPAWALFGAFLAIVRLAAFSYWTTSYYGGAAAAIGGSLMLGALPRLMRRTHWLDSLLLGLGIAIVANSRPFEGVALCLPVAGALVIWLFRTERRIAFPALVPMVIVLCLAAAAMLYHNWRVTGHPLLRPFDANRAQYAVAGYMVWQKPGPIPEYRHKVIRDFYLGWELNAFNMSRGWDHYETTIYEKIIESWPFFVGPVLTIALIPVWRVVRDRRIRLLVIIGAVAAPILSMNILTSIPHYYSPFIVVIYAVILQGLRHVRAWRMRGKRIGPALVRAIPVICLAMVAVRAAAGPLKIPLYFDLKTWCSQHAPDYRREDVIARLKHMGGRHLVIVRYAPEHIVHWEWVYNDADIDASPVVWAREMDPGRNAELIRYFHDRHVWLFEPDRDLLKLEDYPR